MHPSFEQFVDALRDPAQRPGIGLSISDQDAATLLTNADWANDYYARWIALFPPAAAAPAPSPFGPPPTVAPREPFRSTAADAPLWATSGRRSLPSPVRIAIISVLALVAIAVVAGAINEVRAVTAVATGARTPGAPPSSDSGTADQDDPVVFHGLTKTEYDLLEAILAPQGHTLEQAVANGTDDAELHGLAVRTQTTTAKTCSDGEALDNGFGNATFRASFTAGYEQAQKATPAQATAVYDALAAYCAVH